MKTNFFLFFLCAYLLGTQGTFAQTTVNFSFQIWKNSVNLGTFTATASTDANVAPRYVTTAPMLGQLCPGDQLVIKQNCYKTQNNGTPQQLNFNNTSWATIALTSSNLVTAGVDPIGSVCPSSPSPCLTGAPDFGTWLWNSSVTVTIPTNPTYDNYLAIGNNIFGASICGLVAFIPINVAPTTSIDDQTICLGDPVNIPLASGFTYSSWTPNNPTLSGNAPTVNTNYSVEITHATGCTHVENFTINVVNLDVDLSLPRSLCYNQSIAFTFADYYDLEGPTGSTTPLLLTANGETIFDRPNNIFNFPYSIDAPTLGTGTITFEYTYEKDGTICSKTYEMYIYPEIVLNMQNTYAFCSGNFQPIFATSSGIVGQPGITYIWTQSGVPFSVGTGPFFTPSSYGTYQVRAYDEGGCEVIHTFTVYDPGVGIKHPANIRFCSMTQRPPSYVGWSYDPLGLVPYSFNWTYTDVNGATSTIVNTGAQYQVPYQGPGTYTAVVNANGCTETISITVTDLLQVYNNHSNASFSFTPLLGNEVSCQPTLSMLGVTNVWTVVDENGVTISTTPHNAGIKFSYLTGVEYTVTLKRIAYRRCQVFVNQFNWLDDVNKNKGTKRSNISTENTDLEIASTATTVSTFPNPTTGLVNIELKDAEKPTTSIQVLNALGQVVLEKEVKNDSNIKVDLKDAKSGVYMLHIVNGTARFTEKIIKE